MGIGVRFRQNWHLLAQLISLVKWNLFWLATNRRDRFNSVKYIAIIPV